MFEVHCRAAMETLWSLGDSEGLMNLNGSLTNSESPDEVLRRIRMQYHRELSELRMIA